MTNTPLLALPLLAAAQAQKHVTLNEALFLLDGLTQIAIKEQNRLIPPDRPDAGDRYLIGSNPGGAFAGKANMLACFDGYAWTYTQPRPGFLIFVTSESKLYVHDGTTLRSLRDVSAAIDTLSRLGIGTGADANNVLSVKGASALYSASGRGEGGSGSFRFILNKETPSAVLSQLYQTNWSGRAETGLMGDDHYRIKVSPDGSSWFESLAVDAASGAVRFPSGIASVGGGALSFRNLIINPEFMIAQRGNGPFNLIGAGPVNGFDRWRMVGGANVNASLTRTAVSTTTIGAIEGQSFATWTVSAASTGARAVLETRLEPMLSLAGKRVTLSFRYRTNAALSVTIAQNYGIGGSTTVNIPLASSIPLSASWRSLTLDTVLPSVAGKTLGASPFLALQFSAAQPLVLDLADVQLEEGFATPFERRPPAYELLLCRRFFRRSAIALNNSDLALEMRLPPTASGTGPFDYDAEFVGV